MRLAPAFGFALLLLLMIAPATGPLHAQTWFQGRSPGDSAGHPPQSRYLEEEDAALDRQSAFLHFATQYTGTMVVGLLAGGLIAYRLVGGPVAAMAGSLSGALLASWVYLDLASSNYVVREVR